MLQTNRLIFLPVLLPLILFIFLWRALPYPVEAALLTVCSSGCDYDSVAAAVTAAADGDVISIEDGTYRENLVLNKSLILQGEDNATTSLDGGGSGRVISVTSRANVVILLMTIRNGTADDGGGIQNAGDLTLTDVIVTENVANPNPSFGEGGGIDNIGTLTVTDSIISNYTAEYGGGLENRGSGTAILANVAISNNTAIDIFDGAGGGIENSGGTMNLTAVFIINNTANFTGGGIQNLGQMSIDQSTIAANTADLGGGISSGSSQGLTLTNSAVYKNTSSSNGVMRGGAGVYNSFMMSINNSTISGNQASTNNADGGGILNINLLTLASSTIAENTAADLGSGLRNGSGVVDVRNSIVAQNSSGDCSGSNINSAGYNLAGDTSCNFADTGDLNNSNPLLGPLQDNGGPTQTHALTDGSPAENAGNPATPGSEELACPTEDQRGVVRPQAGRCDIGAFERVSDKIGPPPTASFSHNGPITLGETAVFTNTSGGDGPLNYTWDFGDGTTSIVINPTHLYSSADSFTVTLTATNSVGSSTATAVFQVNSPDEPEEPPPEDDNNLFIPFVIKSP